REDDMRQKLGFCAGLISLALTVPAMAHHPGGTSNASEAGPIYTIPATTLEQGRVAAFVVYEFIRLNNPDNFTLATAAGQHQHVHSIGTISSAAIGAACEAALGFRSCNQPFSDGDLAGLLAGPP